MPRKKQEISHRECECGFQTKSHAAFVPKCPECGSELIAVIVSKAKTFRPKKKRPTKFDSSQTSLFDTNETDHD